jgi:hypothetical protein
MEPDDIGVLADVDETFTHDFLRAAQICDVPVFRQGQDCRRPKILAAAMVFESAPDCITKERTWHHPDMVIGECIDLIGDEEVHRPAKRDNRVHPRAGKRLEGYGGKGHQDYGSMPNATMFPLLNAWDFRAYAGGEMVHLEKNAYDWESRSVRESGQPTRYTGYHFHNFFASTAQIRHKYRTYGHPINNAFDIPLEEIHSDINNLVACVMNRSDDGIRRRQVVGGLSNILGPKPLYFDDAYNTKRYEQVRKMIQDDEEQQSSTLKAQIIRQR